MSRPAIDLARLRADVEAVNDLGRVPGRPGINRPSFSPEDMAGRRWLIGRMEAAGLDARMDPVGNVFGRWSAGQGAAVLVGSHLDTVPDGGPFDGTIGVCAALEAVRAMRDAALAPARPVEVVCTADEEGRFGGMLGSQAICGEVGPDWIARARDETGRPLRQALVEAGLPPSGEGAARDLSDIACFLELHVEQGPVLERTGDQIGVAEAVTGVFSWTVTLTGEANHSGTTPMDMRRDAFRGMADFGAAIPAILSRAGGPDARITVGQASLLPGFPHSVAGEARFSIIGRDAEEGWMQALAQACEAEIARAADAHGLDVAIDRQSWLPPTRLNDALVERLTDLSARAGFRTRRMPSGAGHDAQTFARHVPAGLIFVPSVRGISHAPEEWTDWPDIARGAQLLAEATAALAA